MRLLLTLAACAIGALLTLTGLARVLRLRLRLHRCTACVRGRVAGIAQRQALFAWPVSTYYYPIFEFTPEGGRTQIRVSFYYAQTDRQVAEGDSFLICYDPGRPSFFYAKGWDEGAMSLGMGQIVFGLIILAVTAATQLFGG